MTQSPEESSGLSQTDGLTNRQGGSVAGRETSRPPSKGSGGLEVGIRAFDTTGSNRRSFELQLLRCTAKVLQPSLEH